MPSQADKPGKLRPEEAPLVSLQTGNGARDRSVWDDKELFLRKVFDEDPKKGCELLFKQYYEPLCSHAVRFVYSREVAQDLVGELFYVFWQKQLHLQISTSFRAYLFIAVRNRAVKYIRKEFGVAGERVDITELDQPGIQPNPHQAMQYHELSAKIDRGIRSLSPQCQRVFVLSRFEGRKYQEIAKEMKLSLKTVEGHMSKALEVLRKAVRDEVVVALLVVLFH